MRATLLVALLIATSPLQGEEDHWRKLPYPPGRADHVSGIALEGETLWGMFQHVVYWDGMTWRKPAGPALRGGMYLTKFLGGGNQPLYCTQPGERENVGTLLKLSDGVAEPVLEFPFDRPTDPPGIYVSRAGKILNFTQGTFSVYDDGQWVDFTLPDQAFHLTFDRGEKVDVYYPLQRKLFTVGPLNQVKQRDIELPFDSKIALRGACWGKHSALILGHGLAKAPITLDLETGDIAVAKVADVTYYDAFALHDGATLLLARGLEQGMHLCRFDPKGDFAEVPESRGIRWDGAHFRPLSMVEGEDGELWIGGRGQPILRLASLSSGNKPEPDKAAAENGTGATRQFGPETGLDLMDCRELAIDASGNLFAASSRGIYERFAADPPDRPISPRRPQALGQAQWTWKPKQSQLRAAWNLGDVLVLASSDAQITSLSATGEVRFQAKIEGDAIAPPWLGSTDKNRLKVGSSEGILSLDAESGKRIDLVSVRFDPRIAPLPVDGGHLIVRPGRSQAIEKVDGEGEMRWKTALPGYVHLHPITHGNVAIVQTRQGSYGGQATVCIDTREGKILWQDVTDAYGVGAAFAQDGGLVVEADQKMSPELTNGWLICREATTGKRLWDYRVDGSIHHPPLVDATDELVFAVFSRGEVVCLNAQDGRLIWKRRLPDSAFDGVGLSYHAAWSPHSIQGDRLLVVDCNHVLHVIRRFSGKIQAEVLLSSSPGETLVAAPWMAGDALIIPLNTGVTAYRWPP